MFETSGPDVLLKLGTWSSLKQLYTYILQPPQLFLRQGDQLPSLDVTDDTLNNNYVSSEGMLQDLRGCTVALGFSVDIPVDRGDLHIESLPGRDLPGNRLPGGARSKQPVPPLSTVPSPAPTPTSTSAFPPTCKSGAHDASTA